MCTQQQEVKQWNKINQDSKRERKTAQNYPRIAQKANYLQQQKTDTTEKRWIMVKQSKRTKHQLKNGKME